MSTKCLTGTAPEVLANISTKIAPSISGLIERAAAVAQTLVDDLDAPSVSPQDQIHLARVLRVREGESVVLADGAGRWRCGCWRGGTVVPAGEIHCEPPVHHAICIGFSLLKGDRTELVVQKLTELGVDRIMPFYAQHTVVRWAGAKAQRNLERLRRVAYEAAMQSRRVWMPEVMAVQDFADVDPNEGAIAHFGGAELGLDVATVSGSTRSVATVFVGPEGGWSPAEIDRFPLKTGLGPTVLRAETAAILAGGILTNSRNMVK